MGRYRSLEELLGPRLATTLSSTLASTTDDLQQRVSRHVRTTCMAACGVHPATSPPPAHHACLDSACGVCISGAVRRLRITCLAAFAEKPAGALERVSAEKKWGEIQLSRKYHFDH
jgi:hypothetical protein